MVMYIVKTYTLDTLIPMIVLKNATFLFSLDLHQERRGGGELLCALLMSLIKSPVHDRERKKFPVKERSERLFV